MIKYFMFLSLFLFTIFCVNIESYANNSMFTLTEAEDAGKQTYGMAKEAFCNNTFSVGGVLIGNDGFIYMKLPNRVLVNGKLNDPTAHGERQLIDWYFEQKMNGKNLPKPEELTIVTSLDPCLMCTGAILTSGFNVVVVAPDDFAGINFTMDYKFPTFSKESELKEKLKKQFSYFGVEDKKMVVREYYGSPDSYFYKKFISKELMNQNKNIFELSLKNIRELINSVSDEINDPAELPKESVLRKILKKYDPLSLTLKFDEPHRPDERLAKVLCGKVIEAVKRGKVTNAVAFIDKFGNVLLSSAGMENISPIRTAFMELTRSYAQIQREAGDEGKKYFAHPKTGTFVFLRGPSKNAISTMVMGAYGSTMEGHLTNKQRRVNLQYIFEGMPEKELDEWITRFPTLYNKVIGINPVKVTNQKLVNDADFCKKLLTQ